MVFKRIYPLEEATARNKESQRRYKNSEKGKRATFRNSLRKYYGITVEEYEAMLTKQNGTCALCDRTDTLHVDHCHTTGRFRGILCRVHNVAIGALGDNEAGLVRAMAYIRGES